jgi:hypothetical protein
VCFVQELQGPILHSICSNSKVRNSCYTNRLFYTVIEQWHTFSVLSSLLFPDLTYFFHSEICAKILYFCNHWQELISLKFSLPLHHSLRDTYFLLNSCFFEAEQSLLRSDFGWNDIWSVLRERERDGTRFATYDNADPADYKIWILMYPDSDNGSKNIV